MLVAMLPAAAQQLPERSLVRKGNRQYNKNHYESAIDRYREALEAVPGQWEATYNLGNALYKMERYEAADSVMQRVVADTLRTTEERAHALYNLGNAQFKQQKYKEALQSYRQSLLLNPDDQEAKYNYAYTKRLLDENEQNGGGQNNDQQQDQQQNQDQNQQQGGQDQQQNDPQPDQQQGDNKDQQQDQPQQDQPQENPADDGNEQPNESPSEPIEPAISEQEQAQILDAIQAQEDRTQEKLKEKQGVVIRGTKNW